MHTIQHWRETTTLYSALMCAVQGVLVYNTLTAADAMHKLAVRGGLRTSVPVLVWLYDILLVWLCDCVCMQELSNSMLVQRVFAC